MTEPSKVGSWLHAPGAYYHGNDRITGVLIATVKISVGGTVFYRLFCYPPPGEPYIISSQLGAMFRVDDPTNAIDTLVIQPGEINGKPWYRSSADHSGWRLCNTNSFGMVLMRNQHDAYYAGIEPIEWYDEDDERWYGDAFYSATTVLRDKPSDAATGNFTEFRPRGSLRVDDDDGASNIKLYCYWPHYTKTQSGDPNTPYGTYEYMDDPSRTRTVGNRQWKAVVDAEGTETRYVQEFRSTTGADTSSVYKNIRGEGPASDIRYDAYLDKWVIGAPGSLHGWWEGDKPSIEGSTVFERKAPPGSTATGHDITLTFAGYGACTAKASVWVAEVGVIRSQRESINDLQLQTGITVDGSGVVI